MANVISFTAASDGTAVEAVSAAYGSPPTQVQGSSGAALVASGRAYPVGGAAPRVYRLAVSPHATDQTVTGLFRHYGSASSKTFVAINMQSDGRCYAAFYNRATTEVVVREIDSSGVDLASFGTPQSYSAADGPVDYTLTLSRSGNVVSVQIDGGPVMQAMTLGAGALSGGELGFGMLGEGSSGTGQHLAVVSSTAYTGSAVNTAPAVAISSPAAPITLPVGAQYPFVATVADAEDNPDPGVTWASSAPAVATVTAGGLVTAVANGTATITATATDAGGLTGSASRVVTVGAAAGATIIIPEDPLQNEVRDYGVAATVDVPLLTTTGALASPTFVAGDITVSKDGGAPANLAGLGSVTIVNGCARIPLTAAELQGATVTVRIADQDGPAWVARVLKVETQNHPSARYPNGAEGAGTIAGSLAAGATSASLTVSAGAVRPGSTVGFSGGATGYVSAVAGAGPYTVTFPGGTSAAVATGEAWTSYVGAVPADTPGTGTLLNRLGSFTGTGNNTVFGFLRAFFRKDLAVPSDIGGTFNPATDSAEATAARLGAFSTTGTNTVFGFLRSMMRKDLSAPSDVGGTFNPATDSAEALEEKAATLPTAAQIRAEVDANSTKLAAILDDTGSAGVVVAGTVAATLDANQRNAIADSLLGRELAAGVTVAMVMRGEVDIDFTQLTPNSGTWTIRGKNGGTALSAGTYGENAKGRVTSMDAA